MSIRRCSLIVMLFLVFAALAGCGGAVEPTSVTAAQLHVNAVVTVAPNVSQIPISPPTRFTIKLTSTTGVSQPLQVSLIGAPDSYPPQTRGKSLQDAFPGCPISAILNIDTSTPGINPIQPLERSLNDNEDDWTVDVTPQSTGALTLSGEIDVSWACSGEPYGQFTLASFNQTVTVFDPHPIPTGLSNLFTNPWAITIGGGLIVLIIWAIIGGLAIRKPKETLPSPPNQGGLPKTETNTQHKRANRKAHPQPRRHAKNRN